MRNIPFVFLLWSLVFQVQAGVKYVPPNDAQPLIRRDLVPLDVDAIRQLAEELALLADGPSSNSATKLRARVQALTLSQRLSPAQPRARAVLAALANGQDRPDPDKNDQKSAKSNVITTINWLVKLPADSEGQLLGQLLLDILQPFAGKEAIFKFHDNQNAPKRWKGVVAKTIAFEKRDQVTPPIVKKEPLTPKTPEISKKGYAVSALLTEIPMIAGGVKKDSPSSPGLVKTSLVITKSDNNGQELRIKPDSDYSTKALELALKNFFQSIQHPLPQGYNLNVNTDDRRYLTINRENIIAPLAMMLDAALSGRTLRRNTILFAKLQADGTLFKPAKTWDLLLDLAKLRVPDGTRLIVGQGMEEEMTALLVLQKADFFTKFEVIEASDFEAARELFYDNGKPPTHVTAAITGYQEVREKALLATNLNTFLSLATVEKRLIMARDHSPQHLSARMLATQAIRRPAYFSRFMFAQDLDRRLEDTSKLEVRKGESSERKIKNAYKTVREEVDPLYRLVERSERLILDDAVDLLKKLNSAGRVSSTAQDYERVQRASEDLKEFHTELKAFRHKLRQIYQPSTK